MPSSMFDSQSLINLNELNKNTLISGPRLEGINCETVLRLLIPGQSLANLCIVTAPWILSHSFLRNNMEQVCLFSFCPNLSPNSLSLESGQ